MTEQPSPDASSARVPLHTGRVRRTRNGEMLRAVCMAPLVEATRSSGLAILVALLVHTFLTGTRGVIGPLLAYGLLASLSIRDVTCIAAGLIAIASLMFLPT